MNKDMFFQAIDFQKSVLEVINGKSEALVSCFGWGLTPQGSLFWDSQSNSFDIEGAKALLEIVKFWKGLQ